jgi:Rrf2 family protein
MFRLNRLTDYAVVVMMQMTHKPHEVYTAPQLAADTGIPLPTVAKLLNALARESLLSHNGGNITVAEIIQALEGPIALTACVEGSGNHCEVETLCPMRGHWDRVNQAIRSALDQVTLTDMAESCVGLFPEPNELPRESRTDEAL